MRLHFSFLHLDKIHTDVIKLTLLKVSVILPGVLFVVVTAVLTSWFAKSLDSLVCGLLIAFYNVEYLY